LAKIAIIFKKAVPLPQKPKVEEIGRNVEEAR
jgi:hypothetical protein